MPWTPGLGVEGRAVEVRERMPELVAVRLAAHRQVGSGRIRRIETVVNADAVLAVLIGPGGEGGGRLGGVVRAGGMAGRGVDSAP